MPYRRTAIQPFIHSWAGQMMAVISSSFASASSSSAAIFWAYQLNGSSLKRLCMFDPIFCEISWQWLYPWPGRAGHMDSSHPIILWRNMRMLHVFCFSFNSALIIYYQLISNKLDVILWLPTPPASSSSHHHMAKCITPPVAVVVVV